jgi:hypothetical protein
MFLETNAAIWRWHRPPSHSTYAKLYAVITKGTTVTLIPLFTTEHFWVEGKYVDVLC